MTSSFESGFSSQRSSLAIRGGFCDLGAETCVKIILNTEDLRSWRQEGRPHEIGHIFLQTLLDTAQATPSNLSLDLQIARGSSRSLDLAKTGLFECRFFVWVLFLQKLPHTFVRDVGHATI